VQYKGKNIAHILGLTVEDALAFFSAVPNLTRKLQTLMDVGLSYLKLGQSATTLSGGEAQRVKLALELSRRDTGRTLYILDEPTTGLHFADIALLLKVLHQLRDAGNTIVVIEHNLDVIKTADWLIDMGPEGGAGGGHGGRPKARPSRRGGQPGQPHGSVLTALAGLTGSPSASCLFPGRSRAPAAIERLIPPCTPQAPRPAIADPARSRPACCSGAASAAGSSAWAR
jgi:hypothetical protein